MKKALLTVGIILAALVAFVVWASKRADSFLRLVVADDTEDAEQKSAEEYFPHLLERPRGDS